MSDKQSQNQDPVIYAIEKIAEQSRKLGELGAVVESPRLIFDLGDMTRDHDAQISQARDAAAMMIFLWGLGVPKVDDLEKTVGELKILAAPETSTLYGMVSSVRSSINKLEKQRDDEVARFERAHAGHVAEVERRLVLVQIIERILDYIDFNYEGVGGGSWWNADKERLGCFEEVAAAEMCGVMGEMEKLKRKAKRLQDELGSLPDHKAMSRRIEELEAKLKAELKGEEGAWLLDAHPGAPFQFEPDPSALREGLHAVLKALGCKVGKVSDVELAHIVAGAIRKRLEAEKARAELEAAHLTPPTEEDLAAAREKVGEGATPAQVNPAEELERTNTHLKRIEEVLHGASWSIHEAEVEGLISLTEKRRDPTPEQILEGIRLAVAEGLKLRKKVEKLEVETVELAELRGKVAALPEPYANGQINALNRLVKHLELEGVWFEGKVSLEDAAQMIYTSVRAQLKELVGRARGADAEVREAYAEGQNNVSHRLISKLSLEEATVADLIDPKEAANLTRDVVEEQLEKIHACYAYAHETLGLSARHTREAFEEAMRELSDQAFDAQRAEDAEIEALKAAAAEKLERDTEMGGALLTEETRTTLEYIAAGATRFEATENAEGAIWSEVHFHFLKELECFPFVASFKSVPRIEFGAPMPPLTSSDLYGVASGYLDPYKLRPVRDQETIDAPEGDDGAEEG